MSWTETDRIIGEWSLYNASGWKLVYGVFFEDLMLLFCMACDAFAPDKAVTFQWDRKVPIRYLYTIMR